MNFIKSNLLSLITLLIMIAISGLLYGDLPAQLPSGFDIDGTIRASRPRELMVILFPLLYLVLIAVINVLLRLSPQKFSMPNSKRAMDIILFGVGLLFCFVHYALLVNNGDFAAFMLYFTYGIALFFIVVGNVFGKTERNFFIGIRLPWTIASAANWKATHRFAGKIMVMMGVLLLVSNTLYPQPALSLILCGLTVILPVSYSLVYFLKHEKSGQTK